MSGHANFIHVGNQPIPVPVAPIMQQPVAQPQPQQPVDNPEPGDDRVQTATILRELDVLLAQAAASSSAKSLDADSLSKTARKAKLGGATATEIHDAALAANTAMRKIDALSGAELAHAMARKDDGTFDWNENAPAGAAVKAALAAQEALSEKLLDAINKLPAKATAAQQEALEEAMLQCDRRISEIGTVILQIAEIAERGIDGAEPDAETKARLNRRVIDLAGEQSLKMHDHERAIEALNTRLAPLVRRLDNLAAHGTDTTTQNELRAMTREIGEARNALAAAAKSGKLTLDGRDIFVDRTFLDEAAKAVEAAGCKLANLRENVGREAVRKFVENDMPWLWKEDSVFKPEFADSMERLSFRLRPIATLVRKLDAARKAMLALASDPSNRKYTTAWDAAIDFTAKDVNDAMAALKVLADPLIVPSDDLPESFREARAAFVQKCLADLDHIGAIQKLSNVKIRNLEIGVDHVRAMAKSANAMKEEKFLASGVLRDVFRGERTFTSLVESRIHGFNDADIDPELDDRNAVNSLELGSGAFNSVSLVTYKNGRQAVFKPEMAGRLGVSTSPLQVGLPSTQQIGRVNGAVQKTADALGLGDVMVKTTAGTHNGTFGMFMEKAEGVEISKFISRNTFPTGPNGQKATLGKSDILALSDDDYGKVVGRLMRQTNRLEWFDMLTSQGDRHKNNYMVQIRPDLTVSLKGIDNDASYGVFRIGLRKFKLVEARLVTRFENEISKYAAACGNRKNEVANALLGDPSITRHSDGTMTIDLSKAQHPAIAEMACNGALGGHTMSVPDAIDRELFDRLIALKSGAERNAHLAELQSRLGFGTPQFKAAVARLDEAIAHAEKLQREGKVYDETQWETREVQKKVAALDSRLMQLPPVAGATPKPAFQRNFLGNYNYTMASCLFARDFINALNRPGWFD